MPVVRYIEQNKSLRSFVHAVTEVTLKVEGNLLETDIDIEWYRGPSCGS